MAINGYLLIEVVCLSSNKDKALINLFKEKGLTSWEAEKTKEVSALVSRTA